MLPQVRAAAVGPDGAVYAVDDGASVTQIARRHPDAVPDQARRRHARGAVRHAERRPRRAARRRPAATRWRSTADQAQERRVARRRGRAATYLGRSGRGRRRPGRDPVRSAGHGSRRGCSRSPGMRPAVTFSASGHRLYVARGKNDILVFDRFARRRRSDHRPARAPRRTAAATSTAAGCWRGRRAATRSGWWTAATDGSPARSPPTGPPTCPPSPEAATLLRPAGRGRRRARPRREAVPGGADGRGRRRRPLAPARLAAARGPAGGAHRGQARPTAVAAPADTGVGRPPIYLQVSSSQNPAWANELARQARRPRASRRRCSPPARRRRVPRGARPLRHPRAGRSDRHSSSACRRSSSPPRTSPTMTRDSRPEDAAR